MTHRWRTMLVPITLLALAGIDDVLAVKPQVAAGPDHSVAVKADGTVWTWGSNGQGRLGTGNVAVSTWSPVQVSGLGAAVAVAAGRAHTLALRSDGTVWAWGSNQVGQLGIGSYSADPAGQPTPIQVPNLTAVVAITAEGEVSAALRSDGTVWTWGYTPPIQSVPTRKDGLFDVVAIAGGKDHIVALKSDGTVWSWGDNSKGQLGNGTTMSSTTPVKAIGLTGVIAVAARDYNTVAVKSDGTVWAWGDNYLWQCGDGAFGGDYLMSPNPVHGLTGAVSVVAGDYHFYALKSDGTAWGWGYRIGNGYGNVITAMAVDALRGAVGLAAGDKFTYAIKSDGSLTVIGYDLTIRHAGQGRFFALLCAACSSPAETLTMKS